MPDRTRRNAARLAVLLAIPPLAACASVNPKAAALPVCDGRHKRPANPYGSVLTAGLKPAVIDPKTVEGKPAEPKADGVASATWDSARDAKVVGAAKRTATPFPSCGSAAA